MNDSWSTTIHIDMKDLESDIGFDTIRAKYEVAALQLQNLESLKLLKEKGKLYSPAGFKFPNKMPQSYFLCIKIKHKQTYFVYFT